ncbi:MAG: LytTR family DNA-binding domain-containing protein [Cellulophaga sp.]
MVLSPKIKTLIIEDDYEAQNYLKSILNDNFTAIEIIGYADSIEASVTLINTQNPELILMDIILKDGNSFEIFNKIHTHDFEVIFVTAHDNYIKKAIEHYAFSYILKPVDESALIKSVLRYINLKERLYSKNKFQLLSNFLSIKNSQFLVQIGYNHISIKINEVLKCIADGNYTYFHLETGKSLHASKPLKYYEELLTEKLFFKANRSCLINTIHIDSIYKRETIILKNNDKINVSTRNKSKLIDLINSLT